MLADPVTKRNVHCKLVFMGGEFKNNVVVSKPIPALLPRLLFFFPLLFQATSFVTQHNMVYKEILGLARGSHLQRRLAGVPSSSDNMMMY